MVTPDTRSRARTGRAPSPRGTVIYTVYGGMASHTGRQFNRGTSPRAETERGYPTVSTARTQSHERQGHTRTDNVTPRHSPQGCKEKHKQAHGLSHTRTQPNTQEQSHTGAERWPWSHVALLYTEGRDQATGRDHCRPRQVRSAQEPRAGGRSGGWTGGGPSGPCLLGSSPGAGWALWVSLSVGLTEKRPQ